MDNKISIQELAAILAKKRDMTIRESQDFIATFFDLIKEGVERDNMVKIKGLGTFKVIGVDARESVNVNTGERVLIDSHLKISFTPDSTMKELVNKPFSGFETVVLNEGVEFPDMQMPFAKPDTEIAEETHIQPEDNSVQSEETSAMPVLDVVEETAEEITASAPVAEKKVEPETEMKEVLDEKPNEPVIEFVDEEYKSTNHWWKWLLIALFSLAIGVLVGYYAGMTNFVNGTLTSDEGQIALTDSSVVANNDTSATNMPAKDSLKTDTLEVATDANTVGEKFEQVTQESQQAEPDYLKYEAMDDRVRLGAYVIVGTAAEVTVQPEQSFNGICKAYLGPGMQCYVEVYNGFPRNPKIEVGQVIKIPKLKSKKSLKK